MDEDRIAVIGCGNMGRSLIGGLIAAGRPAAALRAADPDAGQRAEVQRLHRVETHADNAAAVRGAGIVILAVKPQSMKPVATGLSPDLRSPRPLIISIAAGIRIADILRWLGGESTVVRAMPNTPALVRAGASALCAGPGVMPAQRAAAERVLAAVGDTVWIEDEELMDVVTALSGSGPAYFFLLMEALESAAAELGLPSGQARALTLATALGAAKMAAAGAAAPAELRRQVTSPGGTTEAALGVLEQAGIARAFRDALRAASRRAAELARTYGSE